MSKQNAKFQMGRLVGLVGLSSIALIGGMALREKRDFTIMDNSPLPRNLLASSSNSVLPDIDYFNQLVALIKREYVESVDDEMKFASGAIRGMILSLSDNYSAFYDLEDARVFRETLRGNYDGLGVDLRFEYPPLPKGVKPAEGQDPVMAVPRLMVAGVVPKGPAEMAGIKVGDWFDSVDGAWVQSLELIERARSIQSKIDKKELPTSAMDDFRKEIREKMEKNITGKRAWQKVMTGKSGETKVVVIRNGVPLNFTVAKRSVSRQPAVGALRPSFLPDSSGAFNAKVKGQKSVTLDLRGATVGDLKTMLGYAQQLVAKGQYGVVQRQGKPGLNLTVATGATKRPVTVLVDEATRGVPAIFAHLLKKSGATITGKLVANSIVATEVTVLPDGTVYTLNLGSFNGGAK